MPERVFVVIPACNASPAVVDPMTAVWAMLAGVVMTVEAVVDDVPKPATAQFPVTLVAPEPAAVVTVKTSKVEPVRLVVIPATVIAAPIG